ncbi:MAG: hypothetical protein JXR76_19045 [Deltaproteobacteria bacterium]|nr:hypothetical protein [Deltaproteobacteria bacterium]
MLTVVKSFTFQVILLSLLTVAVSGCNTPLQSQKYFASAVANDPMMEPIHQTALYTVYFDHALQRCVLHSSYTWGESGGGTGGTGLGVSVFNCNPEALKAHADELRRQIKSGIRYFELPALKAEKSQPKKTKQGLQPAGKPSVEPGLTAPEPKAQPTLSEPTTAPAATAVPLDTDRASGAPAVTTDDAESKLPPKGLSSPGAAPAQREKQKTKPKAPMLQPITTP